MSEWVTWGMHPAYADGVPIKLTAGALAHCRQEVRFRQQDSRWQLAIRPLGAVAFPEFARTA